MNVSLLVENKPVEVEHSLFQTQVFTITELHRDVKCRNFPAMSVTCLCHARRYKQLIF